jgi:hypothetical protein
VGTAYFNVISLNLTEETEEDYEIPQMGHSVSEPSFELEISRIRSRSDDHSGVIFIEGPY